jgi:dipeptidyl aminopeptidase/acylaminoacyl peptidase
MKQRPVEPADLFRLRFIRSAALSPDGKQAAYVVANMNPDEGKEYMTVWLVSVKSGESRQLTSGTAQDTNPQWSPDGTQIAFLSTRQEKRQMYAISVDGGEARQLTHLKQGVGGGPAWSPDGQHIAFTAPTAVEARDPAKPYRLNRFVYRFNDLGYLDDVVQSLYMIPAHGGEAQQLTDDRFMNSAPQWSPDGSEILYLVSMNPDVPNVFYPTLRVMTVSSGKTRDILGSWGYAQAAAWTPDGQQIVFTGQPHGKVIGSKSDLWMVSSKGGKPKCRSMNLEYGVGGGLQDDMPVRAALTTVPLSKDGSEAFVPVQIGGTVQIYRIALEGIESCQPLVGGDRSCLLMDARGKRVVYIVSSLHSPTDLYVCNTDGSKERQLTAINDDLLAELELPKIEHMLIQVNDGAQVEGWAVLPRKSKKPLPTILYIHGGPHGAFGHIFHFDTLMLCGAGYGVLLINHRASTGYGDAFSTAIKGDWGNLDYKDLMAGVDEAIARGYADPDKLGVCGLSGGGNLSCWTVGQTDRFKAAVPENPVTNWVSFYGVSDVGVWFAVEELGGHPHEIPDIYAKCSPITYAHRCKTPTLLVQGESDYRCPAEQSEQFYSVLKANGCTVEMVRLPNAFHTGTSDGPYDARCIHNEVLLEWMNRYVMGSG